MGADAVVVDRVDVVSREQAHTRLLRGTRRRRQPGGSIDRTCASSCGEFVQNLSSSPNASNGIWCGAVSSENSCIAVNRRRGADMRLAQADSAGPLL